MRLDDLAHLPTPCLVVDVDAADRNIAAALDAAGGVALRPHFKAHKCTRLLARQVAAGGCSGVTCATAAEARVLADAGFDDVLVANEVADPAALAELAAAAHHARVSVAVDHPVHVELLEALDAALGVLIDVDVGQHRCGLAPGDPAIVELAGLVARAERLTLDGLQGYDGHAQHDELAGREASTRRTADVLAAERDRLADAGLPVRVISGGGTGTLAAAAAAGVLTEIQAGSYVLMDADYGRLDDLGYEQAVHCVATVISRRSPTEAVLDAGLKTLSAECGLPRAAASGVEVVGIADEHVTLRTAPAADLAIGDRVALVPSHLDPTVNLQDVLYARPEPGAVEVWPVDGRLSRGAGHGLGSARS